MLERLVRWAVRRSQTRVRDLGAPPRQEIIGQVARVYEQVERDFGMLAPPVALHSAAPEVLAAAWAMLRETLIAPGAAPRASKEVVAAAVSRANACPYCVDVHGATLHGLNGFDEANAIAQDRIGSIRDPAGRDLARWAHDSGRSERRPRIPFPAEQLPELLGVAITFHYLNRMVNVHLAESPLPPEMPAGARQRALRFLGRFLSSAALRSHGHGAASALLPAAELPVDLSFAAGRANVADAFARATAAIDAAGDRAVPPRVRSLLRAELGRWDGEPRGPSRAWVEDAVNGLPAVERPAGRLVLLTAMASYQVDDGVITDFRAVHPGAHSLVELTSWASMAAARRVAGLHGD